jgi:hypothetical protein
MQERKRVKSLLKTPEGRTAIREVTGVDIELVKTEGIDIPRDGKPRVTVLMPSQGAPQIETQRAVLAMVGFTRQFAHVSDVQIEGGALLPWLRNKLLMQLDRSNTEYDYVCFCDSDMVPERDHLVKLLNRKKDIVAAACVSRNHPVLPNFHGYIEEKQDFLIASAWDADKSGLVEVGSAGTGFILYSKKATKKVGEYFLSARHEQKYFGLGEEQTAALSAKRRAWFEETGDANWFQLLAKPSGRGEFGEDVSFCFKAREMGLNVYVDTSVKVGHLGLYDYNLDDFTAQMKARNDLIEAKNKALQSAIILTDAPKPKEIVA